MCNAQCHINNNNEYKQKRIVHNEICSHIFMLFLFMHSYFYFLHWEFIIHIILIPQTQKDSLLPPSSPQENYYKVMYFYKCYGGSSILYGDSSKPNWNPTSIVNWFVTQFMIGEKYGIEFGVGLSDATRPWIKGVVPCQPASANLANKILNLYKIFCIQQCKYICSNSDLRFAALDLKELLHQSFATALP